MNRLINLFIILMVLTWSGCSENTPSTAPAPPNPNLPRPQPQKTAPAKAQAPAPAPGKMQISVPAPVPAVSPASSLTTATGSTSPGASKESQTSSLTPVYTYNPAGRKDPFKSILQGGGPTRLPNPAFPLLNYPLSDLKLVAILMVRKNNFIAMVQTPDGKGYTVKQGSEVGVNRARIKEITGQSISIEEEYTEIGGERKRHTVVLSLRSPEEGQI